MNKILFATLLLFSIPLLAQEKKVSLPTNVSIINKGTKSSEFHIQCSGKITPVSADLDWKPLLNNKNIRHHTKNNAEINLIKEQKTKLKKSLISKTNEQEIFPIDANITPVVTTNFQGNSNTGNSPMDNSIAISNGGKIVSVANNSIEFYTTTGTLLYTNTIESFFNDASISVVCDPVVIYDSGADKFIFFAQECSGASSNSNLLICFSETNDPMGNWFNYKVSGNPENNNTWFDYPKMAVSNNEVYITGNSFSNSGTFVEALLFQIEKNSCFLGGTLNYQYWNNIASSPFTLLPLSYGQQGNYGPGIYLVSTDPGGGSSFEFFEITDDMSATNEQLIHTNIPATPYSPAGDGAQLGSSTLLDNGDCRTLSGFYLDGIAHFVFHSDFTGGYNGINYIRLDVANQSINSNTLGLNGSEYSYPSVSSFATSSTDKSVMIGFGKTNSTIFPQIRAVACDNAMNFGSSSLVKSGLAFVDYTASAGGTERWGDYTGTSRKHNNTGAAIWMNGMFGTTNNDWESWIAKITSSTSNLDEINQNNDFQIYPNPIFEEFYTSFDLQADTKIKIVIIDINGKLVENLFEGFAHSGKNIFTFNKANLEKGSYFIKITTVNKTLINEKIIIAN